uniref:1-alkyl-2-acetylglycerophosphocholine esterase n=1 Tax=Macaca fascicularis TaxID=9541 RepID=A0A2K5VIJ1_MACFA
MRHGESFFSPLQAPNFGTGGDTTRHVLWRLKNGELGNIKPKVIVVWVGRNNHEKEAEEVAGGMVAMVQLINTRQPQAKIIVFDLLPQGEKPNPLRQKNAKVNQLLKISLLKLTNVQLLDTDRGFVHSNHAISCHDMFDFLHLTGGSYSKVCKPLRELIMQLLEETPEEKQTTIARLAPISVNSISVSSDQFYHPRRSRVLLFLKALCIAECSWMFISRV